VQWTLLIAGAAFAEHLAFLIAIAQRAVRRMDEHLLQLQNGPDYAMSLMCYLIAEAKIQAFVEDTWMHGGNRSAGRVHALFLDNGGNHDAIYAQRSQYDAQEVDDLFAFGRIKGGTCLHRFVSKAVSRECSGECQNGVSRRTDKVFAEKLIRLDRIDSNQSLFAPKSIALHNELSVRARANL